MSARGTNAMSEGAEKSSTPQYTHCSGFEDDEDDDDDFSSLPLLVCKLALDLRFDSEEFDEEDDKEDEDESSLVSIDEDEVEEEEEEAVRAGDRGTGLCSEADADGGCCDGRKGSEVSIATAPLDCFLSAPCTDHKLQSDHAVFPHWL